MRKMLIVLLLMIMSIGYGQAMLGGDRSDVMTTLNTPEKHYHNIKEGLTDSGHPYICALNKYGDLFGWIFDAGKICEYAIIVDNDNINGYIEVLNKNYVREKTYQWSDYSGGTRIFWWIIANDKFYDIHCSYSNPNL